MKRILLMIGLFLVMAGNVHSQDGGRLEAYKIAFLTKRLDLSPDEAQKFWPIYYKYTADLRAVRQQNRGLDEIALEEKTVDVRKRYRDEFSKVLPPDRVNLFFKSDKEFNGVVQKELQERRELRMERRGFRNNN
jgi:hypothetical protein